MPQSVQIVPRYNYPYVETVINNNSVVTEDPVISVVENINPYICVFTSGKGIDNKLVSTEGLKQKEARYGKSNYKLYGQPFMMVDNILNQQNTKVWTMRVMDEKAPYANSVLSLWYKADKEKKVFRIKATAKSITKYNADGSENAEMANIVCDRELLIEKGKDLDGIAVEGEYIDDEGYTQIPLAIFTSSGRGKYGNNYSWRITTDTDYEKEYGFKIFNFECLESENGTTKVGTYKGSIVSSGKIEAASFVNDVIEQEGIEYVPMDIHIYEDNVEMLYEAFVTFVKELMEEDPTMDYDIPDIDCFDPFFGMQVSKTKVRVTPPDPMIKIIQLKTDEVDETSDSFDPDDYTIIDSDDPTEESVIIVSDTSGIELYGGNDGSFTIDKVNDPTGSKRAKAIEEAYIKAFNGTLDKTILSARRVPASALFDADYPIAVKKVLAKLALFRNDAILYLDTNQLSTMSNADLSALEKDLGFINELEEEFDVWTPYLLSINLHCYAVKESTTGKRVPVTITNYLATVHPNHWRAYGYHTPMVGEDYTTLTGHVKNSLKPCIEEYEGSIMEQLNLARINYFECIGEDRFYRATQNTYTSETSDLTEENNVNTLMWLKRNVQDDARSDLYNFTDPTTRADFAEFIRAKYQPLVGKQIEKIEVDYTMNQWEFDRSIVHMYLAVTFRQMTKRVILEIDINKRVFDE